MIWNITNNVKHMNLGVDFFCSFVCMLWKIVLRNLYMQILKFVTYIKTKKKIFYFASSLTQKDTKRWDILKKISRSQISILLTRPLINEFLLERNCFIWALSAAKACKHIASSPLPWLSNFKIWIQKETKKSKRL